jgi:hypothetical protein
MNRDEIWQQIKNDKSTIYGDSVLDSFLKITEKLDPNHYKELTKEQQKKISPQAALYILGKFENLSLGAELIGIENFNKIEDPLHLVNHGTDRRADQLIDLIKKYHKNSEKLAYRMALVSKNPEEIIKYFGDKIYKIHTNQELKQNQIVSINSDLTKRMLTHSSNVGKLEQVAELVKDKIASMQEKDFKDFVLYSIQNSSETHKIKAVQDLALKYRKITSEEIRVLSYYDKYNKFLWNVFEKQGIDEFGADEIWKIIKPDPQFALEKIGKEKIKKSVIWPTSGRLKMMGLNSLAANLLKLNLDFADLLGTEIISLMDHMDIEYLLRDHVDPKKALEKIKKYHKELDKRIERSPKLANLIGGQDE